MSWFKVTITESCILGGTFHRLCREFQRAFIAAGAPADMALLAQTFVLGNTRDIFFSPGSVSYVADLIRVFDGRPCTGPDMMDVTMVYGVPGSDFGSYNAGAESARSVGGRVAMAR